MCCVCGCVRCLRVRLGVFEGVNLYVVCVDVCVWVCVRELCVCVCAV